MYEGLRFLGILGVYHIYRNQKSIYRVVTARAYSKKLAHNSYIFKLCFLSFNIVIHHIANKMYYYIFLAWRWW